MIPFLIIDYFYLTSEPFARDDITQLELPCYVLCGDLSIMIMEKYINTCVLHVKNDKARQNREKMEWEIKLFQPRVA